jgi:hypothetical protein
LTLQIKNFKVYFKKRFKETYEWDKEVNSSPGFTKSQKYRSENFRKDFKIVTKRKENVEMLEMRNSVYLIKTLWRLSAID